MNNQVGPQGPEMDREAKTVGFSSYKDAAKPTAIRVPPNGNPMEAIKTALASMDPYQGKLKPYAQLVEHLNQELSRTHTTIQAKIQGREYHSEDDTALKDLRKAYAIAIADYKEALDRMNGVEIRDFKKSGEQNESTSV